MLTLKQVYDIGKYINFEITNNKKSVNVSFIGTKVPCFEKIYTPAERNLFLNISAFCFVVYLFYGFENFKFMKVLWKLFHHLKCLYI